MFFNNVLSLQQRNNKYLMSIEFFKCVNHVHILQCNEPPDKNQCIKIINKILELKHQYPRMVFLPSVTVVNVFVAVGSGNVIAGPDSLLIPDVQTTTTNRPKKRWAVYNGAIGWKQCRKHGICVMEDGKSRTWNQQQKTTCPLSAYEDSKRQHTGTQQKPIWIDKSKHKSQD